MTALRLVQADEPPLTNIDIEKAVLGSILIDPRAIDRLCLALKPEHFALEVHRAIYRAMVRLGDAGVRPDIHLLHNALMDAGEMQDAGAFGYFMALVRIENSPFLVDQYANVVIDLAKRRRVAEVQQAIAHARPDELDDLEAELREARREEKDQAELVSLDAGLKAQNERLDRQLAGEKPPRWTGFHALDHKMMRWEKGDLIVLAALTGRGKTAFGLNVAYHLLTREKKRVAFFSLEMDDIQIADRLVGLDAGIPVEKIQDGEFTPDEMQRYAVAQGRLSGLPIRSSFDGSVTVQDIRRKVERLHRLEPFDLVIVDYLGLMHGDGENRTQEVSKMVMGLKALAMDLHTPILALHQLNRNADDNSRPKLSDLKDSSSIEQSSNTVILIHHDPENEGMVEILVEKNRQRKKGIVQLHWDGPTMRFSDIDYRREGV